jgi:hypothetical protein
VRYYALLKEHKEAYSKLRFLILAIGALMEELLIISMPTKTVVLSHFSETDIVPNRNMEVRLYWRKTDILASDFILAYPILQFKEIKTLEWNCPPLAAVKALVPKYSILENTRLKK